MAGGQVVLCGVHKGIPWMTARHTFLKNENGYVLLPPEHPWQDPSLARKEVCVHGGLTHHDKNGWIGFDTAHSGDFWEASPFNIPGLTTSIQIVWTTDLVVRETKRLADQVATRYNKDMKSKRQDA